MRRSRRALAVGTVAAAAILAPAAVLADPVAPVYAYSLSDFTGTLPYDQVRLRPDTLHDEVYVMEGEMVRVFNAQGMEIHRFGDDPDLGTVYDLAVDEGGEIWTLSLFAREDNAPPVPALVQCDFRGEPKRRIDLSGIPEEFGPFLPTRMYERPRGFLLASPVSMRAAEFDRDGAFLEELDLRRFAAQASGADLADLEFGDLTVGPDGTIAFTIPARFSVCVVSPEGAARSFGKPGSAPGRFGVVAGVALDEAGHVFVSDKQRSVVLVFDREFEFVTEFGYRGLRPENLIRPTSVALGAGGKLYVTQMRRRGVSVFSLGSGS